MRVPLPKGDLAVDLSIIELEKLIPHENVIPVLLEAVLEDITKTGRLRDPVLADQNSYLVLDGMHRREALSRLGARYSVCSLYDYESSGISIERWLRCFYLKDNALLRSIISLFDLVEETLENAIRAVDTRKVGVALISKKQCFVSSKKYQVMDVYGDIANFDSLMANEGLKTDFLPSLPSDISITPDEFYLLYPQSILKREVLAFALGKKTFPYKTTRHTFPVRPMGINFPIKLLQDSNKEECENELRGIIQRSVIDMESAGFHEYGGREYPEPLAVFSQNRK